MGLAEKDPPAAVGGGGGVNRSNLHLKKELNQIRKAARMLRDPGTSSSWRQSPNSARALVKQRYRADSGSRVSVSGAPANGDAAKKKGNVSVAEKDKKVFLCNWESQKSGSDSGNEYAGVMLKCNEANFTPSGQRTTKKKSRRSVSGSRSKHQNQKPKKQKLWSRYGEATVDSISGIRLARDELASMICQSEDTEGSRSAAATSPFLAGFKKNGWRHSSMKLLKGYRKDDDSVSLSTPAYSTSSYHINAAANPSIDWDAGTGSLSDADDEVDDEMDFSGCGISCYRSKRSTPKSRASYGSCCSPALSDALRRKGSNIICGRQHRRRNHHGAFVSTKRRLNSGGLAPLHPNGNNRRQGSSSGSQSSDIGELHLEAMSQLDGRRLPSSCRNQEDHPLVLCNQSYDESPENSRSLSHKYRPIFFDELVGQNAVVQSLMTAVSKGRIAPFYLFQGPRGTGKSSAARVFAAALNCLAKGETKPCGVCRECDSFMSGKNSHLVVVDGCNSKGISKVKNHIKSLLAAPPSSTFAEFHVFVVEECHLLPSKTWLPFLRLIENPLPHAVFIFITTDAENMPHTILSRCLRHLFSKIVTGEMIARLSKISADENLSIEPDALELIASTADGSLRDAETMLDQLSLLGKRITISLVNDLMGGVSDEKLLELLELAMLPNTTETVIRARGLLDSGIDPIVLMSQMAALIVDMIAGTQHNLKGRKLTEGELTRLKHALALLSDAEDHLRVSTERSTWFTATLLQLGSLPASEPSNSGISQRSSLEGRRQATLWNQRADTHLVTGRWKEAKPTSDPRVSTIKDNSGLLTDGCNNTSESVESAVIPVDGKAAFRCMDSKMLSSIWRQCIDKCHSKTLRQLLRTHGRLVSISDVKEGGLLAHVAFGERNPKTRAEGFLSSITNSLEIVLQKNVEVKIILLLESLLPESSRTSTGRRSFEPLPVCQVDAAPGHARVGTPQGSKPDIPVKRVESIIQEQRLETAWLQAMEKGTPGSMARIKPERNQVLPQDNEYPPPTNEVDLERLVALAPVHPWEDEMNHEIKALRNREGMANPKGGTPRRVDCCPISPSLLHNTSSASNFIMDNIGYESGTGRAGCGGIFCWNNRRSQGRVKGNPIKRAGKSKTRGISCFRSNRQRASQMAK